MSNKEKKTLKKKIVTWNHAEIIYPLSSNIKKILEHFSANSKKKKNNGVMDSIYAFTYACLCMYATRAQVYVYLCISEFRLLNHET